MKIKFLALAAMLACFPFVGCSLAVPEEGDKEEEQYAETFTDMCTGLMVVLCKDGEEGFVELTSTAFGDENCVALWLDYTAGKYGFFASGSSGDDYLFEGGIDQNTADSGSTCTVSGVVYLNAGLLNERYLSLETLSRDENGELVRDSDSAMVWSTNSMGEHWSVAETKQEIKKTETVNGEVTETVKTLTLQVKITVKIMEVGTDWRILQYGGDGSLLSVTSVTEADEGSFALAEGCAFLVSEETVADGIRRTLYDREDGAFPSVGFFCDGGYGFLKRIVFTAKEA